MAITAMIYLCFCNRKRYNVTRKGIELNRWMHCLGYSKPWAVEPNRHPPDRQFRRVQAIGCRAIPTSTRSPLRGSTNTHQHTFKSEARCAIMFVVSLWQSRDLDFPRWEVNSSSGIIHPFGHVSYLLVDFLLVLFFFCFSLCPPFMSFLLTKNT